MSGSPTTVAGRTEFNPELDGVRGMAMATIFVFHCAPKTGVGVIDAFTGSLWPAIDLFFALSGFLITRNLLDDEGNRYRFRNFYVNRTLRIVPAYLLTLFIVFAVLPSNAAIARALEGVPNLWWFLTYSFNFQVGFNNGWPDNYLLNHFWSLCIEEQFYFLWPLLVFLPHRRWRPHILTGMFLIAFLAEVWLLYRGAHWSVIHSSLFTRLDSLGIGALAAFVHGSGFRLKVVPIFARAFWLASAVLLFCAVMKNGLWPTGWHSHLIVQPTLTVWCATLVYLLVNPPTQFFGIARLFRLRVLTFLGKYSYGVYLFHWIIYMVFVEIDAFGWKTANAWGNFAIVVAATIALAVLSYQLIEKRCLSFKARGFEPLVTR